MAVVAALARSESSPAVDPIVEDALAATGEGPYARRLTDKILAALNQAYGTGEFAIAQVLREALEQAVASAETVGGGRQQHPALVQAELWRSFVGARNAYLATLDLLSDASPEDVDSTCARMKAAWLAWLGE
jgi:hypothetical protein